MYFAEKYKELLIPPIERPAYSDRTAWLMAEMSKCAYLKFETDLEGLKKCLQKPGFELVSIFNTRNTQAFLAKRESDKMLVLSFRGTEKDDLRDILTDLNARFYKDEKKVKIHNGFLKAFQAVEPEIREMISGFGGYSLYITGHSLGGALALIATRALNSDNLMACYTFGSPRVGNEEFDDFIEFPIYRVVNAFDPVPCVPPTFFIDLLCLIPWRKLQKFLSKFRGYVHHGDMRFLTPVDEEDKQVKVIPNYNDFFRLVGIWKHKKQSVKHHAINAYCEKLGEWALGRGRRRRQERETSVPDGTKT